MPEGGFERPTIAVNIGDLLAADLCRQVGQN
jgi:hypothetical protein